MHKILTIWLGFVLMTMLASCSPSEMTWEEQTQKVMSKHNVEFDAIWHYEWKQNVLLVFYEQEQRLFVGFIEEKKGSWDWKGHSTPIDIDKGGYIFTDEYDIPFYITVILTTNVSVHEVKVRGESAKLVQVHPENKIWIAYPSEPVWNTTDIEMLK